MIKNSGTYIRLVLVLMKHRLSMTVAFSAIVGWFLFSSELSLQLITLFIGTFFLSGGASALNQYQERKLDTKMGRTKNRPIPSELMTPKQALITSLSLLLLGFLVLLVFNSVIPAILGILNAVIYNLIYTPLKTKTQYAVLPGAIVGAIPPMMGWSAAGGMLSDKTIIFFATFMFLWQMPHFWLLAIKYGKEYEKAGFSMLTKEMSILSVKQLVFIWGFITSLFLMGFPLFIESTSMVMAILLAIVNIGFIIGFYKLLFKPKEEQKSAIKAFLFINTYALSVMLILIGNSIL